MENDGRGHDTVMQYIGYMRLNIEGGAMRERRGFIYFDLANCLRTFAMIPQFITST